jgi:hypothetical protein
MKYAFEMGSGGMTYTPSLVKIVSGIQKWMGRYIDRQTAWRLHKPTFIFFKIRKVGKK